LVTIQLLAEAELVDADKRWLFGKSPILAVEGQESKQATQDSDITTPS